MKAKLFFCLVAVQFALGCRSLPPSFAPAQNPQVEVRNNAASLLFDLLGDEKNVSKLLIIKRDRRELHEVIKGVSSNCDRAFKTLEILAREDPSLNLKATALPPGEKATREAASKARGSELLHASGADFEFKLLLTQAEALGYAQFLAQVAAQNEAAPEHAHLLANIGKEMTALRQDVLRLMASPPVKR